MYGKKALIISLMAKSEKCSSQKLLIKPGQYIGDCKSAQTDLIITKKTVVMCKCD